MRQPLRAVASCKTHVCRSIGEFRYQKMLSQLPQHTLLVQEKPRVSGKTSYIITIIYLHLPNGPNFRLNCDISLSRFRGEMSGRNQISHGISDDVRCYHPKISRGKVYETGGNT